MTQSQLDLDALLQEADHAFWQVIVRHFPNATSGDLSPLATFYLSQAQEKAVAEWIWANVPQSPQKLIITKGPDHD